MATLEELQDALRNADRAGATDDARQLADAIVAMQQAKAPAATPQAPMPRDSIGRQAGLFARSALSGIAGIPQIVTEPIRQMVVNPIARAVGAPQAASLTNAAESLSNAVGLPEPRSATERIVSKGVEMGMGSGGLAGLGQLASRAPGAAGQLGGFLGQNAGTQAVSGATAGMAGQQAKESGGGGVEQFASTVLGGLAGAGAMGLGKSLASSGAKVLDSLKGNRLTPEIVDRKVAQILVQQGVDPASIGPAVLSKMREDVSKAMNMGGRLDDAAVSRLADYSRVGATPLRGGVTLDPYDVTMQQNAMKMAAATGARDARLPQIANENNRKLIDLLSGSNPNPDSFAAGMGVISPIQARDAAMEAAKRGLYGEAEKMAGGTIPLERGAFVNAAFENLIKKNKMAFLPDEIGTMLNQISKGSVVVNGVEHQVPFDVNTLDTLKTMLATASRGAKDGNVKAAIAAVRDGIESVPVSPSKATFGGNQLVPAGAANTMRDADSQAGSLLAALDKARASAREQFAWQESAPGIEAALGGANPATFVQKNVISQAADPRNVAALAESAGESGRAAIKGEIVQHLLESAIGKGKDPNAANFSGTGLAKAIQTIGDRKLSLFFSPDEIESFKSAARVGMYETFQPKGSAVNNSNTGAAMARLAQAMGGAKLFPGANAIAGPLLEKTQLWALQKPSMNIAGGLLSELPQKGSFAAGLLAPTIYSGGLLSAP